MEKKTVNIYIDTGIRGPRRSKGSYLYIVAMQTAKGTADIGNKVELEETTDNQATLMALETALNRIHQPCNVILHLENQYVAGALKNGWLEQWQENGWITKKGEPVKDAEIWQKVLILLDQHDCQIKLKEPHEYRDWMKSELKGE